MHQTYIFKYYNDGIRIIIIMAYNYNIISQWHMFDKQHCNFIKQIDLDNLLKNYILKQL